MSFLRLLPPDTFILISMHGFEQQITSYLRNALKTTLSIYVYATRKYIHDIHRVQFS